MKAPITGRVVAGRDCMLRGCSTVDGSLLCEQDCVTGSDQGSGGRMCPGRNQGQLHRSRLNQDALQSCRKCSVGFLFPTKFCDIVLCIAAVSK